MSDLSNVIEPRTPEEVEALEVLRGIVAERGDDYTYEAEENEDGDVGCVYATFDGTKLVPSCLVGNYVSRTFGDTGLRIVHDYEGTEAKTVLQHLQEHLNIEAFDTRLQIAMRAAQSKQDDGETWGTALDAFQFALDHHKLDGEDLRPINLYGEPASLPGEPLELGEDED